MCFRILGDVPTAKVYSPNKIKQSSFGPAAPSGPGLWRRLASPRQTSSRVAERLWCHRDFGTACWWGAQWDPALAEPGDPRGSWVPHEGWRAGGKRCQDSACSRGLAAVVRQCVSAGGMMS